MHCESHKVSGNGTDRTFFWNEDQSCVGSGGAWRCTEYSWIRDICQLLDSIAGEKGRQWHLSPNNEGWASNREVSKHPKSKCMGALSWLSGCFVLSGVENKKVTGWLLYSSSYVFFESWQFCIIPISLCDSIIIYMTSFFLKCSSPWVCRTLPFLKALWVEFKVRSNVTTDLIFILIKTFCIASSAVPCFIAWNGGEQHRGMGNNNKDHTLRLPWHFGRRF